MAWYDAFTDATTATRKLIFGYSEKDIQEMQPSITYLNTLNRELKEKPTNISYTSDSFLSNLAKDNKPIEYYKNLAVDRAKEINDTPSFSGYIPTGSPVMQSGIGGTMDNIILLGLVGLVFILFNK